MAKIDQEMNTAFPNDKNRLLANIVYSGGWIKRNFAEFIKPFQLSAQQYNVLRILRGAKDWITMNEVKTRMVDKSPNATRLCDKLVDKKLVERCRSEEDRRAVYLQISEKGLALLKEIDAADDGIYEQYLANLTDEEARIANEILDKLRG